MARNERSDKAVGIYAQKVATQTNGSYRIRRANREGGALAGLLGALVGKPLEQFAIGYLDRARRRLEIARERPRGAFSRDEQSYIANQLVEQDALYMLVRLDQMDSLHALRVRRCARCQSWFWGRTEEQRYCSMGCRTRHYQASPEGKKYKRSWARKERQRSRSRDEEALRLARQSIMMSRSEAVGKRTGV